jgi:multicomponent Na+:H+ antiporter subunit D
MSELQLPILIVVPLFLGVALVPAVGLWRRRLAYPLTMVLLATYFSLALKGLFTVMARGGIRYSLAGWEPPYGIEFHLDMLSAFVVTVIAGIALIVCVYAGVAVPRELGRREASFFSVLFIMLLGLNGMVLTADLFNLYVFFEVSSLAGYALMAVGHRKAAVSAYRYLLLGTVGASFYLLGVGYLYVITGSLNMADVASRLPALAGNPALLVSLVLMVIGLGLKMALFPMHMWLPDAYTYASSTATAIIAPVMTKVSAYVLIRMLFFVYGMDLAHGTLPVGAFITWLGLAGVVAGSVMAIAQKDAKRMLAYSSVAQVAYIAVGIGLGSSVALIGAMLHILNHAAMKSCLFLVMGSVQSQTGSTRIRTLTSLGRSMPWTFAGFTLAALAMVGIPPTNGFFSKWYLVLGGIQAGQWPVVVIIVFSGLLTAVYFFRVLAKVYTNPKDADEHAAEAEEAPLAMRAPVVLLGVIVLLLGVFNTWVVGNVLQGTLPPGMTLPGF